METINTQVSSITQAVIDGETSACEAHVLLKELQSLIESGLKVIQPEVLNEAREFNKGEINFGGVWEVRNTATYLDFSQDEMYVSLNDAFSIRKKDLNAAWKAKQNGKGFFDSDTGEEIPILPVKTASKEIVIFKQK